MRNVMRLVASCVLASASVCPAFAQTADVPLDGASGGRSEVVDARSAGSAPIAPPSSDDFGEFVETPEFAAPESELGVSPDDFAYLERVGEIDDALPAIKLPRANRAAPKRGVEILGERTQEAPPLSKPAPGLTPSWRSNMPNPFRMLRWVGGLAR
ncbi:MAG TPA: hypothetical protein VGE52_21955 [Pirellulales bacterium]